MMKVRFNERGLHMGILGFLLGLFLGVSITVGATFEDPAHRYLDYFHRVYQIIRTEAVDLPSNKDLFYGAIQGMIKSLDDPFSRFLDEKETESLKEMTTGKFVGVGIEITQHNGDIVVVTPMEDTPAMRAGIRSGDVIAKIDGEAIKDKNLTDIIKMIKGVPGSRVKLSVRREGFDSLIDYDLERAAIKVNSVDYGMMDTGSIGYIKIKNFGSDTSTDVRKALDDFNRRKAKSIIVDLRYNPGGLLSAAVEVSSLFLSKGSVVVSTKGRDASSERIFRSEIDPVCNLPLVVLVNRGSASASEIFSGAMRDNKRGKLLGEKTFGKGSVQKTFSLDKDIGVAVTVAKYYTPSGELIHHKGIAPDYPVLVPDISKEDMEGLKKIDEGKILESYVTRSLNYDAVSRAGFRKILDDKKITLSERTANIALKNKISEFRKRPLYDIEFDTQLSAAVQKIGEMQGVK